jgi:Tfp pilus assembly protein PilV
MRMNERAKLPQGQSGVMLLEALIAILIFSLGILSLVALQATAIQLTGDAKYRTDATLLANRLIGQMWVSNDLTAFATGGALTTHGWPTWQALKVCQALSRLRTASPRPCRR